MYQFYNRDLIFSPARSSTNPPFFWLLRDQAETKIISGLQKQVKNGDYFANLAKVLDFAGQITEQSYRGNLELIKRLKNDLVYLQKNYKIVRKK